VKQCLATTPPNRCVSYETLAVNTVAPYVTHVEINRPEKRNAMNDQFWREIKTCFETLHEDTSCRAIILSGAGKIFTAGLDLTSIQSTLLDVIQSNDDIARKCRRTHKLVKDYQASFTSLEKCVKPIISCVHSACLGAGADLICAADIRYCTNDAYFQIKEVDVGLAADVGTLQRMPKIVGNDSLVRELAFTARELYSDEALRCGLVSRVFPDKTSMIDTAIEIAKLIASKTPVAVQGTKLHLNYSRDHTVEEGLDYQASWNMSLLQSEDLMKSAMAMLGKTKAEFSDY